MTRDPHTSVTAANDRSFLRYWLGTYADLAKARLSSLVVVTTGVGYIVASPSSIQWMTMVWACVGTMLCAASANTFNQFFEVSRDAAMRRTANRPLPSGRITPAHAWVFGMLVGYAGLAILALLVNLQATGLAFLTILIYVMIYTPLKPITTLNTLVGAVCGAIPPVIGWVAVTGHIGVGAWVLAGILFIWQLPHFLALAWLYREDYARGGFKMLPSIDITGQLTAEVAVLSASLLVPLTLLMTLLGLAGWIFAASAIILGVWFTATAYKHLRDRSEASARTMFTASLAYLPLVLGALVIDRTEPPRAMTMAPPVISIQTLSP
jgi:protoheme IX farnesyltransferase